MPFFYLEILEGIEKGRRYHLAEGASSIGRSQSNAIALHKSEKSVSGHHAIIYKTPDRIMIQDMQSTNGTYVNDEKVTEKELGVQDTLRFGRSGPLLRLIISDMELASNAPLVEPAAATNVPEPTASQSKTVHENAPQIRTSPAYTASQHSESRTPLPGGSQTLEYEQKLMDKQLNNDEMRHLMKNGKKVEKIINRGNLSQTQSHMLVQAYSANRSMRSQARIILTSVIVVAVGVILFFAVRMFQYKALVDKGVSLEQQLDGIEQRIAQMNSDPDANQEELRALIDKFEKTQSKFHSVKSEMREDDVVKFYTDTVEQFIDQIMMRFGETDYHIPPQMTKRVKFHLDFYSGKLKGTIGRYLKRKDLYFPMILEIFKSKNLPLELAYVSMLESGFNPNALSHAGARGLWQFMPKTGRSYGLRVDDTVDERLDPLKATHAAAEYFKDLIAIFGGKRSVMLAMAAYNAGEGRVMGALRKIDDPMRDRDFWYIYRMGYLAEETNEYIPRILAMMIISEHPRLYGFDTRHIPDAGLTAENDFVELNLPRGD